MDNRACSFSLAVETADSDDARLLIDELNATIDATYGPSGNFGLSIAALCEPSVTFLIARDFDQFPIGCAAIKRHGTSADGYVEVKRMYVRPEARGHGVAAALLAELERIAVADGYTLARLETGERQHDAIRLYTRCGYAPCPPFGHWAAAPDPISRFFEKKL